jgi:hypothetical protein
MFGLTIRLLGMFRGMPDLGGCRDDVGSLGNSQER